VLRPGVYSEIIISLGVYGALDSDISRRRSLPAFARRHVGDALPCDRVPACGLVRVGGGAFNAIGPCMICQWRSSYGVDCGYVQNW
jgi:hypothetical protein